METNHKVSIADKIIEKVSLTFSTIFSPLLVPTYACALALWITPLSLISERIRFLASFIVFVITALIPMATIILMIRMGKVSDAAISNRKERGIPYAVTTACYILTGVFLWLCHAPHWLCMFYYGAAFSSVLAVLINIKWKISAHATVMGGLCSMLFFITFRHWGIVPMVPWLCAGMLLAGAVGTARLYLKRHTPMQVYAGFLMGLVVEYIFMSL